MGSLCTTGSRTCADAEVPPPNRLANKRINPRNKRGVDWKHEGRGLCASTLDSLALAAVCAHVILLGYTLRVVETETTDVFDKWLRIAAATTQGAGAK